MTDGVGRAQRAGGPVETIAAGTTVYFEPGEDHWHGAAPQTFMTHLVVQEVDDGGNDVAWGREGHRRGVRRLSQPGGEPGLARPHISRAGAFDLGGPSPVPDAARQPRS